MAHRIVTLPGDGIGPEIMAVALEVLDRVGDFEYEEHPLGGVSIDAQGTALVVVRELTGGLYFGDRGRDGDTAYDTSTYSVEEIERIARVGFRTARSKVTSVDKANVLETSRLWRETVRRVHAEEFPNVELEHGLVDMIAMKLVAAPKHFDVL